MAKGCLLGLYVIPVAKSSLDVKMGAKSLCKKANLGIAALCSANINTNYSKTLNVHIHHDMPNKVNIGGGNADEGVIDDY